MHSPLPDGHPPIAHGRTGVLLINLGTPDGTDSVSMRRYLKEFLSDRRVIETNPVLWWFILNGIILNVRPKKSAHAYAQIWNKELNESPLRTITRSQATLLQKCGLGGQVEIDWAMRYGSPPVAERIRALKDKGCDRILLFPLYPQYSAATTATAIDKCFDALKTMRWQPAIRTVPPYYGHPAHIGALAISLRAHIAALSFKPDRIVVSFHGLPKEYFDKGDPYHCHCMKTVRLLAERMGLPRETFVVVFQSRFGKAEWLQPYAQQTIEEMPAKGIKKIAVIMPGFSADCVETLEEVGLGLKETFLEKGGEDFATVPCLNDAPESITMLEAIIRDELRGWV